MPGQNRSVLIEKDIRVHTIHSKPDFPMVTNDEGPPSATKTLRLTRSRSQTGFVLRPWSFVSRATATLYDG